MFNNQSLFDRRMIVRMDKVPEDSAPPGPKLPSESCLVLLFSSPDLIDYTKSFGLLFPSLDLIDYTKSFGLLFPSLDLIDYITNLFASYFCPTTDYISDHVAFCFPA